MTDLPSSLGIEAVECVAEGGPTLTIRVIGRWRRRRPEVRGQAMLVVETEGGRQRFLAMPEPPSLTGAAPGTWRMTFSVPAALAPALPGRTYLQLGGVMVPLPIGEVTIGTADPDADGPGADVLEARLARGSELAVESARRRAAELTEEVERLEAELHQAHDESERLREEITERERRVRCAEQSAHAERALRAELEQEMASSTRRAQHDLSVLHDRVAELERELTRLRRAVDEAGHVAATAEAARASADVARADAEHRLAVVLTEHVPAEPAPPPADNAHAELTRRELELNGAVRGMPARATSRRPADRAADQLLLGIEAGLVSPSEGRAHARVAELERELALAREDAEVQRLRSARAYDAIDLVRGELRQLRAAQLAAAAAPPPSTAPPPPPSPPASVGPVQAEEFSAALARLREQSPVEPEPEPEREPEPEPKPESEADPEPEPAPDPEPTPDPEPAPEPPAHERATKPWLRDAFRALARQDPPAAGRLLLALLPAQRLADPHPVAYDLVLSDVLVAHVTSDSVAVHVEHDATPRPRDEVDFQLVGDLASVARLLRAGRVRRRVRVPPRRMARVRGDRRRLAALDRLLDAQLTIRELGAAGVSVDPVLAFTLAALMIEPAWTSGERFVLGHRESAGVPPDAYLHIRDGRPPLATAEAPQSPVATILESPAGEVLGALAGASGAGVGEERPLALLRLWLDRAQSG